MSFVHLPKTANRGSSVHHEGRFAAFITASLTNEHGWKVHSKASRWIDGTQSYRLRNLSLATWRATLVIMTRRLLGIVLEYFDVRHLCCIWRLTRQQ